MGRRSRSHLRCLVAVLVAGVSLAAAAATAVPTIYRGWQKGPWERHDHDEGLTVFTNEDVKTGVEAVRVDAMIPVPANKLFPIIIDENRARSYSFVKEFKIIKRRKDWGYLYQRVQAPGVDDRDFTVRLQMIKPKKKNGGPYGWKWKQANEKGPDPRDDEGIVRAEHVEGSYLLIPIGDGSKTLVSYRLWFDPSSWVPDFLINVAVRDSVKETVARLRTDAKKL